MEKRGKSETIEQFKRGGESRVSQLDSYNKFNVLAREIQVGTPESEGSKKGVNIRKLTGGSLKKITVKIGLERIDTQEGIMVEALLDSRAT